MTASVSSRHLKVFLCHSSGDKDAVRVLYRQLRKDGFDPWFDEEKLIGGQNWEYEIRKAVRETDAVVVCLSNDSISKTGSVQKELKFALDIAEEQPEGGIFMVPLKLEPCNVPVRLAKWQWISFFQDDGYERLVRSLRARSSVASEHAEAPNDHVARDSARTDHYYVPQEEKAPPIGVRAHSDNPSSTPRSWSRIAPYALIALVSFLCGVVLAGLMISNAERIISL